MCLNSVWGKFGQRANLDRYEYITEWNRLLLQLNDDKRQTKTWHTINQNCVELRYQDDIDYDIEAEYISEITAVFTTANARVRLYSMLDWLDPSQLIYCDTHSIFVVYDKLILIINTLVIKQRGNHIILHLVIVSVHGKTNLVTTAIVMNSFAVVANHTHAQNIIQIMEKKLAMKLN